MNSYLVAGATKQGIINEAGVYPYMLGGVDGSDNITKYSIDNGDIYTINIVSADHYNGDDTDEVYANGATASYKTPLPGESTKMYIADGSTATKGQYVVADGAGGVRDYDGGTLDSLSQSKVIGVFEESKTIGDGTTVVRVRIRS